MSMTTLNGSCVLKASVARVSADTVARYIDQQSGEILANTWLTFRLRVGRVSVNMLFKLIDRWSTLSVSMSVDTRLTPRLMCCDQQLVVLVYC